MKHIVTQAIILNRLNYGEADRIIKVLTLDHGKVSLLAKGVRLIRSKLAGGLELFSVTNITFIDGKSDLKTVISSRLETYFSNIVSSMESTQLAYEFIKMIDESTHEDCGQEYFELLKNALEALHEQKENSELVSVWFMVRLLEFSGAGLNYEKQANGQPFDEEKSYNFSFDDMAFIEHRGGLYQPQHIKFLRLLAKVSKPSNLIQIGGAARLARELKILLAQSMNYH